MYRWNIIINGLVNPHRVYLVIYLENAHHNFGVYLMPMVLFYMIVLLLFFVLLIKNRDTLL